MILYIISFINIFRLILLAIICLLLFPFLQFKSFYYFLYYAGPSFIKLGQLLSTRPDLIGNNFANILSTFQDRLKAFPYRKAAKIIYKSYHKNIDDIFLSFDKKSIASGSIAQIYKAKILYNKKAIDVAVKILRPNIRNIFRRDIKTLKIIRSLLFFKIKNKKFFHSFISDIIKLLENSLKTELDLRFESMVTKNMKAKLSILDFIYIPQIYGKYSNSDILITEFIDAIALSDTDKINNLENIYPNINKKDIANQILLLHMTQIYKFGIFHADMHPGNLFINKYGQIILIDFGIIGYLEKNLKENIIHIIYNYSKEDYVKVAKYHLKAKLVPADTDLNLLAMDCKMIGEKTTARKLKDVNLAIMLELILNISKKYQMKTDPNLLLLHKTIILIESLALKFNPEINIWDVITPWVKNYVAENMGFDQKIIDFIIDLREDLSFKDKYQELLLDSNKMSKDIMQLQKNIKRNNFSKYFLTIILSFIIAKLAMS